MLKIVITSIPTKEDYLHSPTGSLQEQVMANKFCFITMLIVLAGCDGDKKAAPIVGCLGFVSPQVVVEVTNTFGGQPVKTAQVKVNITGGSFEETVDAVYVENGTGIGSYVGITQSNASEYQLNIAVVADGFHNYQSAHVPFRLKTSCGADNTTHFKVELCPIDALCE
jgi:hypothetical protein